MKVKIIVALVAILFGLALTHFFVFSPLAAKWSAAEVRRQENLEKVRRLIEENVPLENTAAIINSLQKQLESNITELERISNAIEFELQTEDPSESKDDPREAIISNLYRIEELQNTTEKTEVQLLESWGIGDELTQGRFGKGLVGNLDTAYAFPVRENLVAEGCIEFLVKPMWSPLEDREYRVFATLIGYDPEPPPGNMQGKLSTCSINIVKTPDAKIQVAVKDYADVAETYAAQITSWKQDSWHHLAVNWNKTTGEVSLYLDGRAMARSGGSSRYGNSRQAPMFGNEMMLLGEFGRSTTRNRNVTPRYSQRGSPETAQLLSSMARFDAIYIGADHNDENPAEVVFDEFRLSRKALSTFDFEKPVKEDENTVLIRHFENKYAPPDPIELALLLESMKSKYRFTDYDSITAEHVLERFKNEYEILRRSLGINVDRIEQSNIFDAALEELYLADFLRKQVPSSSLDYVIDLMDFKLPDEGILNALSSFLEIAYDLAETSIQQQVKAIKRIRFIGESPVQDESEIWDAFNARVEELKEKYPSAKEGGMLPPWMLQGGAAPGMGLIDPMMMAEGFQGIGYMSPGGTGRGASQDPEADLKRVQETQELNKYQKSQENREIHPEFMAKFLQEHQGTERGTYLKRMIRLRFEGSVEQLTSLLHEIEYGERLASIDNLIIRSKDNEKTLDCSMKIDLHFLEPSQLEEDLIGEGDSEVATGEVVAATPQS